MSESPSQKYLIRDNGGNVYGPADGPTLVEWVGQGRIVPGMSIAPRETREWTEVSQHPLLQDALQRRAQDIASTSITPETPAGQTYEAPTQPTPTTYDASPEPNPYGQTISQATDSLSTTQGADLQYASLPPKQNVLGIIGLICGVISIVSTPIGCLCGCVAIPSGLSALVAIVLSSIALFQIRSAPNLYLGRKMALTGLILGIATIVLFVAGILFAIIMRLAH